MKGLDSVKYHWLERIASFFLDRKVKESKFIGRVLSVTLGRGILAFLLSFFVGSQQMRAQERHPLKAFASGRSMVIAPHGIVCTSHPLAAQIGLDILKNGGNAMDAAIACNAAMGLMEPMSCGIGGDLYAMVWDEKSQKLYGLNASGGAPAKMTRAFFQGKGLHDIPLQGPLCWTVPGCVDGWDQLRQRFGTMTFKQLFAPTIAYARQGVPVPEVIAWYWSRSVPKLKQYSESSKLYLRLDEQTNELRAPKTGELFFNPALAHSYELIAAKGRDVFYEGEIADELVKLSQQMGGLLQKEDLRNNKATWVEPVSTTYRGYDIYEIPPPGQGIAVLQMLNLLEPYDLRKMGPNSADYWHLWLESKKLAYADRAKYYADPRFVKVPVDYLISKKYAQERRKLIDLKKAKIEVPSGDEKISKGDTIYLCVVDKNRNCVSLIQSNYYGFGSGIASSKLGFALQNRGNLFSLQENHANRLEPGKRPFHTIIPAMVFQDKKPFFVFGVMGGDMQPQGQTQVLVNLIDFQMNIQQAGEAPRLEHIGSATPTGEAMAAKGGTVLVERGIPASVIQELKNRGHQIREVPRNFGGYQGILIDRKNKVLQGASEPRTDGAALGY